MEQSSAFCRMPRTGPGEALPCHPRANTGPEVFARRWHFPELSKPIGAPLAVLIVPNSYWQSLGRGKSFQMPSLLFDCRVQDELISLWGLWLGGLAFLPFLVLQWMNPSPVNVCTPSSILGRLMHLSLSLEALSAGAIGMAHENPAERISFHI